MRAGDWVEVRSKDEILSTLDEKGRLEGLPFMPQMFEFCGQRLRVEKSAHKTCDTISGAAKGRRVTSAVHLESVRCDGQAFGGCGAACTIFWKTAWLRPIGATTPADPVGPDVRCTEAAVLAGTRFRSGTVDEEPTFVCQATELLRASAPLPWWDLRQYWSDFMTGNARLGELSFALLYSCFWKIYSIARRTIPGSGRLLVSAYDRAQALWGGVPFPRRKGRVPLGKKTPIQVLDLLPGELVRVKPYEEILATLDADNKNRGLYFDAESVPYCGKTFRVRSRVARILDEKTGRLIVFGTPSVILEGVVCRARFSHHRMLCPRAIFPYWREAWLDRVAERERRP
jgi:hypothetical protein